MDNLLCLFLIFSLLNSAIMESRNGDHQKCLNQLKVVERVLRRNPQVEFYKLYSYHKLNQKQNVIRQVEYFEGFVTEKIPERYMVVAALIKNDVEQWEKDDLADVSRDMSKVTDKLKNGYVDKVVIKDQKDIVDRLSKMIEDAENAKKKQAQSASQGNSEKGKPKQEQTPLDQTQIVAGDGTGQVNQKRFSNLVNNWGSLPPRQRGQILQELTKGLSPRHQQAIFNYFQNLANSSKKR